MRPRVVARAAISVGELDVKWLLRQTSEMPSVLVIPACVNDQLQLFVVGISPPLPALPAFI